MRGEWFAGETEKGFVDEGNGKKRKREEVTRGHFLGFGRACLGLALGWGERRSSPCAREAGRYGDVYLAWIWSCTCQPVWTCFGIALSPFFLKKYQSYFYNLQTKF